MKRNWKSKIDFLPSSLFSKEKLKKNSKKTFIFSLSFFLLFVLLNPVKGSAEELGVLNISSIKEGSQKNFDISESKLTSIAIKAKKDLTNKYIKINSFGEKPEPLISIEGNIYKYYLLESDIKNKEASLSVMLKVPESWFTNNKINKNDLTILKWHDDGWINLNAGYFFSEEGYHHFRFSSNRFGYFAIGVTGSQCPTCPKPEEWSECTNGTKTRINYRCDKETNYECKSYTEKRSCIFGFLAFFGAFKGLPWTWIFAIFGGGFGLFLLIKIYRRYQEYKKYQRYKERYKEYYKRYYSRERRSYRRRPKRYRRAKYRYQYQ